MEAPGPNRRLFVIVAVQRTGSTWLVRELDRHPCLRVGAELFLDVKPDGKDTRAGRRNVHTWTEPAQHAGMVGLLDSRVRGADAIPFDVGGRYDRLRRRCDTLTKTTTGSISCGFKWMVSQKFESSWAGWFLRMCREQSIRLVFLTRENPLRVVASMADKIRGQDSQRVSKKKGDLELWTGPKLLKRLDRIDNEYEFMRRARFDAEARGVAAMATSYETLRETRERGLDEMVQFVLGGGTCRNARGNASKFRFETPSTKRRSRRSVQVHPRPMSSYIGNWADVVATLRGTRYERFLTLDGSSV